MYLKNLRFIRFYRLGPIPKLFATFLSVTIQRACFIKCKDECSQYMFLTFFIRIRTLFVQFGMFFALKHFQKRIFIRLDIYTVSYSLPCCVRNQF